ncbi:O-antigen ligase family protein [Terribacillus halophilus]|uniref:O-antigen ligase family protein n=1 Tax=Terribacillus halophilus TaxID=361279 RepID=UPI000984BD66|nr:hypothetical protein [Terribacillus halophilus]
MIAVGALFMIVGFISLLLFIVLGIISIFKKNGKGKLHLGITGGAFALLIIGIIIVGVSSPSVENANASTEESSDDQAEKTPEESKAEEEKAAKEEAEAKAQAEKEAKEAEEAKAKAEQEAKEKKENAQPIEYAQLEKNPDRYTGEYVKYQGQVVQIQEGDNITNIRLAVTQDSYGYNSDDIVYVEYEGYTDFVDEDIVTVYGEVYGSYSYTSQAGWEITLPAVIADTVE